MAGGRPTKYNPDYHPKMALYMTRSGLTEAQIAKEFDVTMSTVSKWKKEIPEFSEALNNNKKFVDYLVEDSLLKRALGYEYEETETTTQEGKPDKVKVTKKTVVPDTTAQIFWLKNRKPGEWRDKHVHDVQGSLTVKFDKNDKGLC